MYSDLIPEKSNKSAVKSQKMLLLLNCLTFTFKMLSRISRWHCCRLDTASRQDTWVVFLHQNHHTMQCWNYISLKWQKQAFILFQRFYCTRITQSIRTQRWGRNKMKFYFPHMCLRTCWACGSQWGKGLSQWQEQEASTPWEKVKALRKVKVKIKVKFKPMRKRTVAITRASSQHTLIKGQGSVTLIIKYMTCFLLIGYIWLF